MRILVADDDLVTRHLLSQVLRQDGHDVTAVADGRAALQAHQAQPYPLLKLVLEDRWGERVREREFEPADYLDPATAPDRLLGPAQQATATIAIVDPGPDAEGFRFDVCLCGRRGIVCAADVPERR